MKKRSYFSNLICRITNMVNKTIQYSISITIECNVLAIYIHFILHPLNLKILKNHYNKCQWRRQYAQGMILMSIPHLAMGVSPMVEMLRVKNSLRTLCTSFELSFNLQEAFALGSGIESFI